MSATIEQSYMQGRDTRWDKNPETAGGACFALSLFWAKKKLTNGIDSLQFWTWLGIKPNATNGIHQGLSGASALDFLANNNPVLRAMQQQIRADEASRRTGAPYDSLLRAFIKALLEADTAAREYNAPLLQNAPNEDRLMRGMTRYYYEPGAALHVQVVALVYQQNSAHMIACAYHPRGPIFLFDPNAGEVSWNDTAGVID